MTAFIFADNVNTTLGAAASSSAATLTLASSANLPTLGTGQQMPLTLNDAATGLVYEVCYVTAISGATLTVIRAQEGTTAQNWSVGDKAACMHTAQTTASINGNALQTFEAAAAIYPTGVVNLSQFPATLSASGYQKLPNGYIRQWLPVGTTIGATTAFTWPIAFPTACLSVATSDTGGGALRYGVTPTTTGGNLYSGGGTAGLTATAYVEAIGN